MLVTFEQVFLRYGQSRPVLSGINFSLPPASFHFLTGPSGAGKSSLFRLIYRAEVPSEGRVTLFGQDSTKLTRQEVQSLRRRLGIVFQDFRLIPHLTALENAALPLLIAGAEAHQVRQHVKELLAWVGLGDKMNALPSELSGGEQQRVALARAVVNKPKLLLADEPTGNVDDEAALKLLHLFKELNKMGTAVLLATHQQNLVEKLGLPAFRLLQGHLMPPISQAA